MNTQEEKTIRVVLWGESIAGYGHDNQIDAEVPRNEFVRELLGFLDGCRKRGDKRYSSGRGGDWARITAEPHYQFLSGYNPSEWKSIFNGYPEPLVDAIIADRWVFATLSADFWDIAPSPEKKVGAAVEVFDRVFGFRGLSNEDNYVEVACPEGFTVEQDNGCPHIKGPGVFYPAYHYPWPLPLLTPNEPHILELGQLYYELQSIAEGLKIMDDKEGLDGPLTILTKSPQPYKGLANMTRALTNGYGRRLDDILYPHPPVNAFEKE